MVNPRTNPFKVGDRVAVKYDDRTEFGIIHALDFGEAFAHIVEFRESETDYIRARVAASMLRRLKPKKKKRTVSVERWVNVYADGDEFTHLERTDGKYEKPDNIQLIACVKLTGSYQVEE